MKIIDQIYLCQIPGQVFGVWNLQCRLRIFQPHREVQTVLITDMGIEKRWFIPYMVEQLITQIVDEFNLDPQKLVWIEHYTPTFRRPTCPEFSQVIFDWNNGYATNPQWMGIALNAAQTYIGENLAA